jgi:hypothetical protein
VICDHVTLPGGINAIVCGRGRRKPPSCKCGRPSTKLCDFEVKAHDGHAQARTCDKPLCDACAVSVGKNRDFCPDHPRPEGAQLKLGEL